MHLFEKNSIKKTHFYKKMFVNNKIIVTFARISLRKKKRNEE